jgi:hypothetical protein
VVSSAASSLLYFFSCLQDNALRQNLKFTTTHASYLTGFLSLFLFLFLSCSAAPQRNFHLRTAISQLNDLLYSRMLSKGHSSDNPDSVYQGDSQGRLTAHMVPSVLPFLLHFSVPPSLPPSLATCSLSHSCYFSSVLYFSFSLILTRPLVLFQLQRSLSRCPLLPHTVYTSLSSIAVTKCCAFFRYFHPLFLSIFVTCKTNRYTIWDAVVSYG